MSGFSTEALVHTEGNLAARAKAATKSWMKVVDTIVQDTDFDALARQALGLQSVDTKLFMGSYQKICVRQAV